MDGRDHPQQASSSRAPRSPRPATPLSATEKNILIGAAAVALLGVLLGRRRKHKNRYKSKTGIKNVARTLPAAEQRQPRQASSPQPDARLMQDLLPVLTSALSMLASWRAKRQQQEAQDDARKAMTLAAEVEAKATQFPAKQDKRLDADVVRIVPGNRAQVAWQLSRAAVNAWLDDFAPSMGAAIAYYTAFSIAPVLIIAIAIAGMIFGHDAAQGEIVWQIRSIVGEEGAIDVQGLLRSVSVSSDSAIATTLSVITLVIGSTAVFAELQNALDRIWRTPAAVRGNGVWLLIRTRLLSFGLILGLGFMLMVSLVVSAALAALGKWWGGWIAGWEVFMQILNLLISFGVFTALFSAIYKFMPRADLSWHDVRIGAVATTILFLIGKSLIGLYLGRTGMSSGFGAAGSFALLLAWIYYSSQIFLLGAEFTWIYANNFGSRAKHRTRAEKIQEA